MRVALVVVGVVLLLLGLLWALQGAGVVGGGFMSGQRMWLVIGIVVALVGLVLGFLGLRPRTQATS
ncbi:MAG TPA: hypothetical protein VOB72_26350 [Candidatus Dormibacteraeota bacterium]|nr:hypothetical protein [Candidatus Dormibacteraeota bacterium]